MTQISIPEVGIEEKEMISKSILAELAMVFYKICEESLGKEDTLKKLEPYANNAGIAFATNMRKRFAIEGKEVQPVAEILALGDLFFGIGSKIIDQTEDRVVFLTTDCFWSEVPGLCKAQGMWKKCIVNAINPNICIKKSQMIASGDSVCIWSVERKKM